MVEGSSKREKRAATTCRRSRAVVGKLGKPNQKPKKKPKKQKREETSNKKKERPGTMGGDMGYVTCVQEAVDVLARRRTQGGGVFGFNMLWCLHLEVRACAAHKRVLL